MLHRAHAYIASPSFQPHEVTVLFEVPLAEMAKEGGAYAHMQRVLGWAWGCQPELVTAYNLKPETELRRDWGHGTNANHPDHDLCLLCVGDGPDGPIYAPAARTLVLVGWQWLQRLARARERIDVRAANRKQLRRAVDRHATTPAGPTSHRPLHVITTVGAQA
jgi:hypothetical protein